MRSDPFAASNRKVCGTPQRQSLPLSQAISETPSLLRSIQIVLRRTALRVGCRLSDRSARARPSQALVYERSQETSSIPLRLVLQRQGRLLESLVGALQLVHYQSSRPNEVPQGRLRILVSPCKALGALLFVVHCLRIGTWWWEVTRLKS